MLSVNGQQLSANATREHVVAMVKSNPDKVGEMKELRVCDRTCKVNIKGE